MYLNSLPNEKAYLTAKEVCTMKIIRHRPRSHQLCLGKASFISLMSLASLGKEEILRKRSLSHWLATVSGHDPSAKQEPLAAGGIEMGHSGDQDLCGRLQSTGRGTHRF